ncbi:Phospho-N-acetylmuramoyl-pentapeptide-transferase [Gossypium australe]|uniref:Phospho-N-acetylmuramoyl-pentapeptide-transferase n=1 Tax=Gossypium australe TaxID=47621 RepID=A0A5B6WVE7_9ROSI|nr:Phospho-N-acetylmuramoyl-pentapeptide-transferase [Gossypium australe]
MAPTPLQLQRKMRSAIFSILHCNFRKTRLKVSSICFLQLQEDEICYLQSTPLQLQGDKAESVFDLPPATSGR